MVIGLLETNAICDFDIIRAFNVGTSFFFFEYHIWGLPVATLAVRNEFLTSFLGHRKLLGFFSENTGVT